VLHRVSVERDVPVTMRDGVRLFADVFRPAGDGPFPVLILRTPYEKQYALSYSYAHPAWYAANGYVVVVQDTRGRYRSEGAWEPFRNEPLDGFDTVAWAAALPGTSGRVGMYGASYPGAVQIQAAIERAPGLACICPAITSSGPYADWTYEGGALHLAFATWWAMSLSMDSARRAGLLDLQARLGEAAGSPSAFYAQLPLSQMPLLRDAGSTFFFDWLAHDTFDDYWKRLAFGDRYGSVGVPGLHIGGWYDIFLNGTLRNFTGIDANGSEGGQGRQRLLIGPWYHYPWSRYTGQLDFGTSAASSIIDDEQLRFYDWILRDRDDGIGSQPPVRLFVMGENRWRDETAWPLARAVETPYYLHSAGRAAGLEGDGTLSSEPPLDESHDTYFFNPADPSPSRGGHSCCEEAVTPMGPYDQRQVERRMDVLCYTSRPLADALEVTGPVSVTLWAATNAVDTDWVARLVDVYPDGRAINLTEGIIRASYRNGVERRELVDRDKVTKYRIDLRATSNVFLPGHRVRVDVASSSFPLWDRNPNTGMAAADAGLQDLAPATQAVFHDAARPSHIILPIVPRPR
jgi:uncharacterized protein